MRKSTTERDSMDSVSYTPHSVEAEISVLGAMMLDPRATDRAAEALVPGDFYDPKARTIFVTARDLRAGGVTPDPLAVMAHLRRKHVDADERFEEYLATIVETIPTAANVEFHAKKVKDDSVRRLLMSTCQEVIGEAASESNNVETVIDRAEQRIYAIANDLVGPGDGLLEVRTMIRSVMAEIMSGPPRSFKSGFHDFDFYTNGFRPKELTVLAARPSMGKTGLAFQMAARCAVKAKKSVAVFSLEMGAEAALKRMISIGSGVEVKKLINGPPDFDEQEIERIDTAVRRLEVAPLWIDGDSALSSWDIKSRARRIKSHAGLDLVVVDYLQRMRVSGRRKENRNQEIGEMIRDLKSISKDLDVSVLCLSQLTREVEKRENKMPVLSDLRESGDIEQEADCVVMMYRPGYYAKPVEGGSIDNMTNLNVAKNRNGPTGRFELRFVPRTASFQNWGGMAA